MKIALVLLITSALTTTSVVSGAKILMLPFQMPSHVSEFIHISNALLQRGHDVYMMMGEKSPSLESVKKTGAKVITHRMSQDNSGKKMDIVGKVLSGKIESPMTSIRNMAFGGNLCYDMLGDEQMFQQLKQLNFDYGVVDGIHFNQCLYVLLYKLGLNYSTMSIIGDPCLTRTPALPSFVPLALAYPRSEKMDFWERMDNFISLADWCFDKRLPFLSDDVVRKYAPEMPFKSINELARQSDLWLMDSDIILDYPRPTMPNEVMIGGLTLGPAKSLPSNLLNIVESATDGVVIMSFGSSAPDIKQEVFLQAFSKIKQVVLWRFKGKKVSQVPSNVHLLDWLPQADLLAHPNVKLFITHCGANGQFEGVYHGVPMINFPMFAEQHYNAKRSEYHGYGRTLKLADVTADQLVKTINEIISNPSYEQKVTKASQILKSRPDKPADRAVYWIEHVMAYGGNHLKSYAVTMPWYQYLMLDVLGFLFLVTFFIIFILAKFVKLLCRCCCGGKRAKVKTN